MANASNVPANKSANVIQMAPDKDNEVCFAQDHTILFIVVATLAVLGHGFLGKVIYKKKL